MLDVLLEAAAGMACADSLESRMKLGSESWIDETFFCAGVQRGIGLS